MLASRPRRHRHSPTHIAEPAGLRGRDSDNLLGDRLHRVVALLRFRQKGGFVHPYPYARFSFLADWFNLPGEWSSKRELREGRPGMVFSSPAL